MRDNNKILQELIKDLNNKSDEDFYNELINNGIVLEDLMEEE